MNTTTIIIILAAVAILLIGGGLAWVFYRRKHKADLRQHFGPEYEHTVQAMGDERKAQAELEERQKRVEALDIHPLSTGERDHYMAEWRTIQSNFVDDPNQAIVDADRLIQEVMQIRAYPVSNFEQQAADLSVNYPEVVSNYRAAHEIAIKNAQKTADTEELRRAMVFYRSLFEDLLETQNVEEEKPVLQEVSK